SVCETPLLCRRWAEAGGAVCGTFLDGVDFYKADLPLGNDSPVIIVVGNESEGISPETAAEVTSRLFIPRFPAERIGSESLNASVATAITLAEFRRRS
ncbi:MAG: RNA methyltransferase, partial [Bacteroidales bacterium]|nr:RNA methyltransferase [Bacteroidales bacterium]